MVDYLIRFFGSILSIYIVILWIVRSRSAINKLITVVMIPLAVPGLGLLNKFHKDLKKELEHPSPSTLYHFITKWEGLFLHGRKLERILLRLEEQSDDIFLSLWIRYMHRVINAATLTSRTKMFIRLFSYATTTESQISVWQDELNALSKLARFDPGTALERIAILNRMLKHPLDGNLLRHKAFALLDLGDAFTDILRLDSKFPDLLFNDWIDLSGYWIENYIFFMSQENFTKSPANRDSISLQKTVTIYKEALKIFVELGLKIEEALVWEALGDLFAIQEKYSQSTHAFSRSMQLAIDESEMPSHLQHVSYKLGVIAVLAKNWPTAEMYFRYSLQQLEISYEEIGFLNEKKIQAEGFKVVCGNGLQSALYCLSTENLTPLQRNELFFHIFHYLDTEKGRTVTEFARFLPFSPPANIPIELIKKERELLEEIREIHQSSIDNLFIPGKVKLDERQEILKQLNNLWRQIKNGGGDEGEQYEKLRKDIPLEFNDLEKAFHSFPSKTGFLYLRSLGDGIIVFLIRLNPFDVQCFLAKISLKKLKTRYINDYMEEITSSYQSQSLGGWRELGKELFGPLTSTLKSLSLLYLVPDKVFEGFPLHILWVDAQKKPLIDYCPVVYTSSLRLLNQLHQRTITPSAIDSVIIGCSKKPKSSEESIEEQALIEGNANEAARILGSQDIYLGNKSSGFAMQKAQSADIIHIACHGSEDIHKPGILIGSGLFSVREIMTMEFNSDLVFLSVCLSRRPEIGRLVSEYVDTTEAFLCSGARSTISALWSIPAHSTQYFVSRFYQHLVRHVAEGIPYYGDDPSAMWQQETWMPNYSSVSSQNYQNSKAKALQLAMFDVRSKYPQYQHWAGFVLSGCYN